MVPDGLECFTTGDAGDPDAFVPYSVVGHITVEDFKVQ